MAETFPTDGNPQPLQTLSTTVPGMVTQQLCCTIFFRIHLGHGDCSSGQAYSRTYISTQESGLGWVLGSSGMEAFSENKRGTTTRLNPLLKSPQSQLGALRRYTGGSCFVFPLGGWERRKQNSSWGGVYDDSQLCGGAAGGRVRHPRAGVCGGKRDCAGNVPRGGKYRSSAKLDLQIVTYSASAKFDVLQ